MADCHCAERAIAMRSGEMFRDRYGRWKFPYPEVAQITHDPPPRFAWTFCPFCGGTLPYTDDTVRPLLPPYEASPDATGGDEPE